MGRSANLSGAVSQPSRWSRARRTGTFAAITLLGVFRIVLTYGVFGHTVDEPAHIGSGMAWLTGVGEYEYQHPPLARVVAALPLFLAGFEWPQPLSQRLAPGKRSAVDHQGHWVLNWRGDQARNLAMARAGMLAFFVAGAGIVWLWSRRLFGEIPAAVALGMYVCLPPVLGHAGLATTDMALGAMAVGALYAFVRWLEVPSVRSSLALGLLAGLAVASKFSAVLFLAAGGVAILLTAWAVERPSPGSIASEVVRRIRFLSVSVLVLFVTVWAVYRFAIEAPVFERPTSVGETREAPDRTLKTAVHRLLKTPVPAGGLVRGLLEVRAHQDRGHFAFFFGEFRDRGWWYYYPVELLIKSPIPFLLLALAGAFAPLRRSRVERSWANLAPLSCAVAILAAAMSSHINIGIRHVLPVYLLLCIVASRAANEAFRSSRRLVSLGAVGIPVAWLAAYSFSEHPDYLASFSEAVRAPEEIVSDSDLDWGQDLRRLSTRVRELGIERIAIGACSTCRYPECANLPEARSLVPGEPVSGWVAIGEWCLRVWPRSQQVEKPGAFAWLEERSYERIGKSIRLYYLPPGAEPTPPAAPTGP